MWLHVCMYCTCGNYTPIHYTLTKTLESYCLSYQYWKLSRANKGFTTVFSKTWKLSLISRAMIHFMTIILMCRDLQSFTTVNLSVFLVIVAIVIRDGKKTLVSWTNLIQSQYCVSQQNKVNMRELIEEALTVHVKVRCLLFVTLSRANNVRSVLHTHYLAWHFVLLQWLTYMHMWLDFIQLHSNQIQACAKNRNWLESALGMKNETQKELLFL